ncbi:MAG: DMT family transporter [Arenicellales bacterium]|nr:DMT family transporter [Arenicellales bacterium]
MTQDIFPSPAVLALCSALLFAVGVQVHNLGLRYTDSRTGTLISILASALFYWSLSPWFLQRSYWLTSAVVLFIVIGLFRPFLSANLALAGIRHLGPTLSSTLASTAPLFGALFAVLILDESMTPALLVGTVAIVSGIVILTYRGNTPSSWPVWALGLPIGAAVLRALAHALTKLGLNVVPDPLFAGLVGYTVSLTIALIAGSGKTDRFFTHLKWTPGLLWFFLGGLINGVSIWSLNTALQTGTVVSVVPIVAVSPVLSFFLGYFVFRRETFTFRIIITMLLVVPGVIMIASAN